MRLLRTPKIQMAIVLTALSLLQVAFFPTFNLVLKLILILSFTLIIEVVFWQVRKASPFVPSAAVVTALIIFLLAHPLAPLWQPLLACALAVLGKQFVRPGNHHIFNPAAWGLLIASFVGLPITWWGAIGGNPIYMFILVLGAGFVTFRTIHQAPIVVTFLLAMIAVASFTSSPATAISQLIIGSILFFTLIMLPEPMTAAKFPKTKLIYGTLVATLSLASPAFTPFGIDPLLGALLVGNGVIRFVEAKFPQLTLRLPNPYIL